MQDIYKNIRASLSAIMKDSVTTMIATGTIPGPVTLLDFDAAAEIEELPTQDCAGIGAVTLTNDENLLDGACMFVVTTFNDKGLLRLTAMMNYIFNQVQPGQSMNLVDATTGAVLGNLIAVSGASILPVENTKTRPLQAISLHFKSSHTLSLP